MLLLSLLSLVVISTPALPNPTPSEDTTQGVNFILQDWHQAVAQAAAENKYLLLDAYTDWCTWCKVQDKTTFADPEMAAWIEERFIPLKVNMEEGVGIQLAAKFRPPGYPSLLLFNPQGQLVYIVEGYIKEFDAFKAALQNGLDITEDRVFAFDSQALNPGFPQWYVDQFDRTLRRKMKPDELQANALAFLDTQSDLFSEVSWAILSQYSPNAQYQQWLLDHVEEYRTRYGHTAVQKAAIRTLQAQVQGAISEKDHHVLTKAEAWALAHLGDEAESTNTQLRIRYLQGTQDWEQLVHFAQDLRQTQGLSPAGGTLRQLGWTLFSDCEDQAALTEATAWMKDLVAAVPEDYGYQHTYSALLYKTGRFTEARQIAEAGLVYCLAEGRNPGASQYILRLIDEAETE